MCGLPASGKTTAARVLAERRKGVRLSPDEWLYRLDMMGDDEPRRAVVEEMQWELAQALVAHGGTVILEAGFWSKSDRDEKRERARQLGARVELHVLDVPVEELARRVVARNADLPAATFTVSPEDIAAWAPLFEIPQPDELALFDPAQGASAT